MKDIRLLTPEDIDVKVKQVSEKGAVLLLYKNARVDMRILDDTFGAMNWETEYKEIKGNLYCGIGARESENQPFVWKWNCGIESREDGDGNEKKGEASDAFKRAGFLWGIGRELYTAPFVFANVPVTEEKKNEKTVYKLKNSFEKFRVKEIDYIARVISKLVIVDSKNNVVYDMTAKFAPQTSKTTTTTNNPPKPQTNSDTAKNEVKQDVDLQTALNTTLNFGKHKGKPLQMVDIDYLHWLVDNSTNDFIRKCASLVIAWENDKIEEVHLDPIDDDGLPF